MSLFRIHLDENIGRNEHEGEEITHPTIQHRERPISECTNIGRY